MNQSTPIKSICTAILWLLCGMLHESQSQLTPLKEIHPGAGNAVPETNAAQLVSRGRLYFTADDGVHGNELWISDGTNAGTYLLKDIVPGSIGSEPAFYHALDSIVVFITQNLLDTTVSLWLTDGSPEGTMLVTELGHASPHVYNEEFKHALGEVFNGVLYFQAKNQIWRTDGTPAGTFDIDPTEYGRRPKDFITFDDKLFYTGGNSIFSEGSIYYTDGTEEGTQILEGPLHTQAIRLTPIGNRLYFIGHYFGIATDGNEPWVSDGTDNGTFYLANINTNVCFIDCSSMPYGNDHTFQKTHQWILFGADDNTGYHLWRTNGTRPGTSLLKKFSHTYDFIFNQSLHAYKGAVLMFAADSIHGMELWSSEGEPSNTFMVKDMNVGTGDGITLGPFEGMYTHQGLVYFRGFDGLWKTDGTQAGTARVPGFSENQLTTPGNMISLGNNLILSAYREGRGFEYYIYSPSIAPMTITSQVIHPSCHDSSDGEITVVPTGGVEPYTIEWIDAPLSGFQVSNLSQDNYICIVYDAEGNSAFKGFDLIAPPAIDVTIKATPATQHLLNGAIQVTASGGIPPYAYAWSHDPFVTTSLATHLAEGTYTCTITDDNGCEKITQGVVKRVTSIDAGQRPTGITLTPNPITGEQVILRSAANFSPGTTYSLFNSNGELVISGSLPEGNKAVLNTNPLLPGIYFFQLNGEKEQSFGQTLIKL